MSQIYPAFSDFENHYNNDETQIVYCKHSADFDTALSAYYKLTGDAPYSFLLESVEGGAHIGRYSIIACKPDLIWQVNQDKENPITDLREHIKQCHISKMPSDIPSVCAGGMFGYLGYEMVHYFEPTVPNENDDALEIPEGVMMRPKLLAVFDNVKHELTIAVPVLNNTSNSSLSAKAAYDEAQALIQEAINNLNAPINDQLKNSKTSLSLPLKTKRNFTDEEFRKLVSDAKEHIYAGDIFQIVPSQRFRS